MNTTIEPDSEPFTFYLGSHMAHWLGFSPVPLFVSDRKLRNRRTFPRASSDWCLDSGGFTELSLYGEWRTTPEDYVHGIRRYQSEIGRLQWASQQDMMVEDVMLARTGLTIADHQQQTINNFLTLRTIASDLPIIPVIQGQTLSDYLRHIDAFNQAGIDLTKETTVGIGSVCRRQASKEIVGIVQGVTNAGIRLHGFGMKTLGLTKVYHLMQSADSMAWSFIARKRQIRLPQCTHKAQKCQHCMEFAILWRQELLESLQNSTPQLSLF
jgi:hypothetical protein